MARSHHRKSHKQHLQNFKQHKENASVKGKAKTTGVFGLIGLVLGMAIGYIATSGSLLWMGVFAIVFGIVGYLVGQKLDKG
jgi:Flp pilus assembly protein TadB